ncbi:MAG: hypothetical protein Q9219_001306 [cf. Caloplaca sp. 3 TL-2023]
MPAYRNITINLVSQFDILNIPEYEPPAAVDDPFTTSPTLINNSLVSCYVPIYPLSQFWLSYSVAAPHPPKALYYFKLFINGAPVVSWGCGEENGFKGKTMYGLYDSGERWMGEPGVEARVFNFTSESTTTHPLNDSLGQAMEVRVYRARGRKRIKPDIENFQAVVARSNDQRLGTQSKGSKSHLQNIKGAIRTDEIHKACSPPACSQMITPNAITHTLCLTHSINHLPPFAFTVELGVAQLEALGVTQPLHNRPKAKIKAKLPLQEDKEPSKSHVSSTSNHSPESASDISPLTIRGLSVPALSLINLPTPSNLAGSPLKRTISPTFTPSSGTASSQSRFAQLIRRSSRSPSPPRPNDPIQLPSPTRIRRTASMGLLMGAVQSAIRRSGKGSREFRKAPEHPAEQGEEE